MLKAIETTYKGYRFRSRLEARWAVFFDALKITWAYEVEGFDLGPAGRYLPDFHVVEYECPLWVEIKGGTPSVEELNKAKCLAEHSNGNVIIAAGTPGEEKLYFCDSTEILGPETTFGKAFWCIVFHHTHTMNHLCAITRTAYTTARSARFEHGETPWT
jgi:hypothetical protein